MPYQQRRLREVVCGPGWWTAARVAAAERLRQARRRPAGYNRRAGLCIAMATRNKLWHCQLLVICSMRRSLYTCLHVAQARQTSKYRVYNTYTDASNGEWGRVRFRQAQQARYKIVNPAAEGFIGFNTHCRILRCHTRCAIASDGLDILTVMDGTIPNQIWRWICVFIILALTLATG